MSGANCRNSLFLACLFV